ncbi:MAG: response regulator [Fimbriiglobus sp.]|jgi:two-component system chemotaxis response regulator CheY|nr:response regulator [Fimbriiglobus sp.]
MTPRLKALVIDDSAVMRKMVMKAVTDSGLGQFEFVEAEDGQDGLNKLGGGEFHIAFVDWNMPNMTGIDFVRAVRKQEREKRHEPIGIVMVTSEKTMGKIQEALDDAGADTFIIKPFTAAEMGQKLKKVVEKAEEVCRWHIRNRREQATGAPAPTESGGGFFSKLFG